MRGMLYKERHLVRKVDHLEVTFLFFLRIFLLHNSGINNGCWERSPQMSRGCLRDIVAGYTGVLDGLA